MPVDRSQTFLTLPICGVAAWLYTLIVEPLFGKAMKNPVVQAGCAAVTVVLLVTVLYTPPAAPKHWQYEEAAKLYHDLVSKLPRGSWTIVGQNEDFELALNEGYHMTVSKFLSDYPPQRSDLQFPTPYMFLIVEKKPMPQPDKEQAQIRRTDEELLLDWVRVYAATHSKSKPMAVHPYEETENVAIYLIYDSEVEQRLPSSSVLD